MNIYTIYYRADHPHESRGQWRRWGKVLAPSQRVAQLGAPTALLRAAGATSIKIVQGE